MMSFGMSKTTLPFASIVTALVLSIHPAFADNMCSAAPKSKYQDRAKLDDMLKPKGLMINRITDDHGCYKVDAVTRQFKKVVLYFNAETLKQIEKTSQDAVEQTSEDMGTDGD